MFFRLNASIEYLLGDENLPFQFSLQRQRTIDVLISLFEGEMYPLCEVTTDWRPSEKNQKIFTQIERGDCNTNPSLFHSTNHRFKRQDGTEIVIPHLLDLPKHFQDFIQQVSDELEVAAKNVVSILRWRCDLKGSTSYFKSCNLEWSHNKEFWYQAPANFREPHLTVTCQHGLSKETQSQLSQLVNEVEREPIYHELFREAWEQRFQEPRSAIVIGISAAEVSIKQCIGILVPKPQWLADNLPSPPILDLLQHYLPTLPAKNQFNGKVLQPPQDVLNALRKGVNIRNSIVHAGKNAPKFESTENILLAVRDILWLIDYYCGYEWALNYLSEKTLEQLKESSTN